ncbi:hypothetical protein AFM16_14785 [Streptomyces antibioticus]|uniref:Uncharacterized protein n=1 Tax=Streptomyces antibioticus TaxID=1890 RepID=A0ABX3LL39_STRAT|nr:hypothetical protein AFM16_14785 [Streptomyces antibioticus]
MSGATSQRVPDRAGAAGQVGETGGAASRTEGTVTASPVPWHSNGGIAPLRSYSSQRSSDGSRWAVPGAANSRVRPRNTATGPEPGPSPHSRSSISRPNTAGTLTTSKTEPHGSTTGASGRSSHRARVLRG